MHLDAVHEAHGDRLVESVIAGRLAQRAAALQMTLSVWIDQSDRRVFAR
jgi:hypothetical protein